MMLKRLVLCLCLMMLTLPVFAIDDTDALEWEALAPMSVARSETGAALVENKIYVVGGLAAGQSGNWVITNLVEVYDIETDTWSTLSPLPTIVHHAIVTAHNGIVYVFGGSDDGQFTPLNTAYAYDIETDTWLQLADMLRAMMATQAVVIDETIYIAGGKGGRRVLAYDIEADSWRGWAASNLEHDHTAIVLVDEQIFVLGGRNSPIADYNDVEIYDTNEDSWTIGTSMLEARSGFGAILYESYIIAFGGELIANNENVVIQSSEIYDLETDTWEAFINLPIPLHGMPVLRLDNRIYMIGGISDEGLEDDVWMLDLSPKT